MKKFTGNNFLLGLAVLPLFLAGCASYTIQPLSAKDVRKWNDRDLDPGYIFYQPELYFMVTPGGTGAAGGTNKTVAADTMTVSPVYLPNPQKPYQVTTFNFLAKSDFTFNFKDGWQLTSIADKADNSTMGAALVGQMKTILDSAITMKAVPSGGAKSFLLHPNYDDKGIIIGLTVVPIP